MKIFYVSTTLGIADVPHSFLVMVALSYRILLAHAEYMKNRCFFFPKSSIHFE